jgi:MFS family permease
LPATPFTTRRSERALDALTFFLADVQDGLGPFLAIYLVRNQDWPASSVGVAMASIVVGTLLVQVPAGGLIDRIYWKRWAVIGAAVVIGICSIVMVAIPTLPVVAVLQALTGASAAVMLPAVAGISLGLVGTARLPQRASRNEAFNHAGNVSAAVLAGAAGTFIGYWSIFYLVALMAALSAGAAFLIRETDIDHAVARGADVGEQHVVRATALFSNRALVYFLLAMFLFHFSNAAMLPLVGQKVSVGLGESAAALMSSCIVAAQIVMIPVALLTGRCADRFGRKPVFLIGFAVLAIRGMAYLASTSPYYLVAVQLLDGVGAGIYGVASVLVISDLTRGTGRFNLAIGALATFAGLGAAASNLAAGVIAEARGYDAGFLFLALVAIAGFAFYIGVIRESRPETAVALSESTAALSTSIDL